MFLLRHCFFSNDTATTEIYTLSLHDALPISVRVRARSCHRVTKEVACARAAGERACQRVTRWTKSRISSRSEEHTSELQSRQYLVCRLLLEKKKKKIKNQRAEDT